MKEARKHGAGCAARQDKKRRGIKVRERKEMARDLQRYPDNIKQPVKVAWVPE